MARACTHADPWLNANLQVLHIADALHNTPRDPLCVKALQRAAAARQALGQHGRAAEDLRRALDISGGSDAEIEAALRRAELLGEEAARQKRAVKALAKAGSGSGGSGGGEGAQGVGRLAEMEELVRRLSGGQQGAALEQQQQLDGVCDRLKGRLRGCSWVCKAEQADVLCTSHPVGNINTSTHVIPPPHRDHFVR